MSAKIRQGLLYLQVPIMRFDNYQTDNFHDEMFDASGIARPEARLLLETIQNLEDGQLERCQRAAEQVARQRGFTHVFAMSLAESFFRSLDYQLTPLHEYPEKVARYSDLEAAGVEIVPKRCFRKALA